MADIEKVITVIKIIIILSGGALCFFGWMIYRDIIKLIGGLVGLIVGALFVVTLEIDSVILGSVIILSAAWIGAELSWGFHEIFTFVGGAISGILVYKLIFVSSSYSSTDIISSITNIFDLSAIDVVFAFIGGIIALVFHKGYVIIFTTILGSGLLSIIFGIDLFIPLLIIGSMVQYGITSYLNIEDAQEGFDSSPRIAMLKKKLFGGPIEENDWKKNLFEFDKTNEEHGQQDITDRSCSNGNKANNEKLEIENWKEELFDIKK